MCVDTTEPLLQLLDKRIHETDAYVCGDSSSTTKWETEVEKTEAIIRHFEEASRSRALNDAGDGGLEEIHPIIEDALLDVPIPRSLEALDLAGM